MRIQTGVNAQLQSVNSKENQSLDLKIGTQITGKVIAVDGKNVVLQTSMGSLKVLNMADLTMALNTNALFEIVDTKDGVYMAKPIPLAQNSMESTSQIKAEVLLGKEGASILEALKTLNIPITQSTFEQLKTMGLEVKVLAQMLQSNDVTLDQEAFFDMPLKDVIKSLGVSANQNMQTDVSEQSRQLSQANLLSQNDGNTTTVSMTSNSETVFEMSKETQYAKELIINQLQKMVDTINATNINKAIPILNLNDLGSSENLKELANAYLAQNHKDVPVMLASIISKADPVMLEELSTFVGQNVQAENMSENHQNQKLVTQIFKSILDQITPESNASFLKNNIALNLNNIILDALVKEGAKSINDSVHKLNQLISKLPKAIQLDILNQINQKDADTVSSLIKYLQSSNIDEVSKQKIVNEISFIRDSAQITSQFGDQVMVLNLPVTIEDRSEQVALYMKKRNKDQASDDKFTILVALNTKQIGEVRCIVEKNKDHYYLNFKLENEEIRNQFETGSNVLNSALKQIGIENVQMNFAVMETMYPGLLLETPIGNNGFDLSV